MIADEYSKTKPTLEMIWESLADIHAKLTAIQKTVNENKSSTVLAGNMAKEACNMSEEALSVSTRVLKKLEQIDQSLGGVYELAKSGFDIATTSKSYKDKGLDERGPVFETGYGTYRIVGTGN